MFSIPYISADELATIELDGYLDDWKELSAEPTLTPFDFNMFYHPALTSYAEYDPGNLDFRIWVAWTDGGKIYVAAEIADDVYRNVDDESGHFLSDHIAMKVDGDHSGGSTRISGAQSQRPICEMSLRRNTGRSRRNQNCLIT